MLLSTEGLKRDSWETRFLLEGNKLVSRRCGTVLELHPNETSKLPSLDLTFGDCDSAFVCTPCVYSNNTYVIPRRMNNALVTKDNGRTNNTNAKNKLTKLQELTKLIKLTKGCSISLRVEKPIKVRPTTPRDCGGIGSGNHGRETAGSG